MHKKIRNTSMFLLLLCLGLSCNQEEDYKLVWNDEFESNGLPDSTKWSYDTEGNAWSWGNNELQQYTSHRTKNAEVIDGKLFITALKEEGFNQAYTSARLITRDKGDWLYGKIDVCAMVPGGKGAWPAIWMLPTDWEYGNWPKSGEIDIMEHVGYEPDSLFFSIHTEAFNHTIGTQKSAAIYAPDSEKGFHVYSIEWTAKQCDFFFDKEKVFSFKKGSNGSSKWPFDKRFHLILNVAIGGNWGGKLGVDDDIFPCQMVVDYVRVYQKQ